MGTAAEVEGCEPDRPAVDQWLPFEAERHLSPSGQLEGWEWERVGSLDQAADRERHGHRRGVRYVSRSDERTGQLDEHARRLQAEGEFVSLHADRAGKIATEPSGRERDS